ncbi:MAG: zinc-dependent metalloprotease, partial [Bacteroidota bacterium]
MRSLLTSLLLAAVVVSGCTTTHVYPPTTAEQPATPTASAATPAAPPAPKDPFKPWAKTLEDTKPIEGLFTFHLKRDNTLFLEVAQDQLDQDFGLVMHYSRGVGDFNLHDGLPLTDMQMMRLTRVGDNIHLVHRNPRFIADEGSPMANSLADNMGHSVAGVFKIESQHKESNNLLIDVTPFIVSDYANVAQGLRFYFNNQPPRFDKSKSYVENLMGFPENVEIDAALAYTPSRPVYRPTVTDGRSIPIGVRYSFVKLPDDPMMPRYADDRVGNFITARRDFSRDQADTPYLRYVERWRLEPQDPAAIARGELSEPVEPIVFYIDHSVPHEYRPYVKEGIEGWNKGFEAAGFKNAIVALEAPDDSTWSAEDARFSTVRWTAAQSMGYAIGPSQTDPRTGEILNADILISSTFVTGWRSTFQRLAADPNALFVEHQRMQELYENAPAHMRDRMCLAESGKGQQMALQYLYMMGLGTLPAPAEMTEEFLGDAIRDLIMHEVGHTLGMRHNFKGSAAIPTDKLHDESFTRQNGVSLSVMEYAPVNVAVDPDEQGHYYNVELGAYDVWATQYAYTPVFVEPSMALIEGEGGKDERPALATTPEQELEALQAMASQAASPLLAYNTDEDNWIGPYAVDPMTNAWDLGSDALAFARNQAALMKRVEPVIEERLIEEGEGYQQLRGATASLLYNRMSSLAPAVRYVGGLYFARDHKGDPNQRMPFTPVAAAQQREAVALIVDQAFAQDAIDVDAEMLNKMAPNRYNHWGQSMPLPVDFPIHNLVKQGQGMLMTDLLHPVRLQRMIDNEARVTGEAYTISEMLQTLTGA